VTLLAAIVETSRKVGAASARLAKVRELSACLRALAPDEIEIGVQYLSGETRQGRFGLGYATLSGASDKPASIEPTLRLADVDRRLDEIAVIRGAGATARRCAALGELFALSTTPEREFLIRLLVGELRQGALIGVMIDAIAAAASLPVADVRRAAMYSRTIGAVARVALLEGAEGLKRFQLELLVPVAPMLAQTAADTSEALAELAGEIVFEWKMDGARIQVHKSADIVLI
jgi:DNA ligase-1